MIDKDFELRGEAAERPESKKLTAADIPDGYRYAAVDSDGRANGYKDLPELFEWQYDSAYDSKVKYLNHKTFIGIGYDCTDWKNSLVKRETAERPKPKKLTAADIPEGFNYAAVDASGNTVAYYEQPFLAPGDFEWSCYTNDFKPIGVFDASDWQNSLVSRENAERPQSEAIKDQQDKPSFLEIDPNFLEAMAWRMTANKGKYPVNNWKGLTDRFAILDAIYRHANDIKRMLEGGESLTGETIQKHCAAIACNAMFLHYHTVELNELMRAVYSRKSNAKEI